MRRKTVKKPFSTGSLATEILQINHLDVCGPIENKSIGGARYVLFISEDNNIMILMYFLKAGSEV